MERKKLEDRINSKMEMKIEKQRESATQRENLLQKEIKSWQVHNANIFSWVLTGKEYDNKQ